MFPGHIRALKDVWIIGDHLARLAYPYLQEMDQDHRRGLENYLQENYDHSAYYPCFTDTNVLSMIRNSFVEGLKKRPKLPNTVIILFGEQFIIEDPLFLPSEFERKIKWLIRELEVNIKIRKGSLPSKAYTMGQPRLMFVQAFRASKSSKITSDQLLKFNNLLRRTCMAKAVYTIPVDDSSLRCFDHNGKTQIAEGFRFLWQEIINGLKFHDEKDQQYEINQLVDNRLKEMDWNKKLQFERKEHTYESVQKNISGAFRDPHNRNRSWNNDPERSDRSRHSENHASSRSHQRADGYSSNHRKSHNVDPPQRRVRYDHRVHHHHRSQSARH